MLLRRWKHKVLLLELMAVSETWVNRYLFAPKTTQTSKLLSKPMILYERMSVLVCQPLLELSHFNNKITQNSLTILTCHIPDSPTHGTQSSTVPGPSWSYPTRSTCPAPAIAARLLIPGCANRVALRCLGSVQIFWQHGENPGRIHVCLICFHSEKPKVSTAFGMIMDDHFLSCAILFCTKWHCPSNDQGRPKGSAMAAGHESKMGQLAEDFSMENMETVKVGCWGCRSGGSKCAGAWRVLEG